MSSITTHILDTSSGRPAAGVGVEFYRRSGDGWERLSAGRTDTGGRLGAILPNERPMVAGTYRLRFLIGAYFASQDIPAFYPRVDVIFGVDDPKGRYHIPLLVSPYGYSTYRGS